MVHNRELVLQAHSLEVRIEVLPKLTTRLTDHGSPVDGVLAGNVSDRRVEARLFCGQLTDILSTTERRLGRVEVLARLLCGQTCFVPLTEDATVLSGQRGRGEEPERWALCGAESGPEASLQRLALDECRLGRGLADDLRSDLSCCSGGLRSPSRVGSFDDSPSRSQLANLRRIRENVKSRHNWVLDDLIPVTFKDVLSRVDTGDQLQERSLARLLKRLGNVATRQRLKRLDDLLRVVDRALTHMHEIRHEGHGVQASSDITNVAWDISDAVKDAAD